MMILHSRPTLTLAISLLGIKRLDLIRTIHILCKLEPIPPIYLHLIFAILQFEIFSLMKWIFSLFQTGILQTTAGRKIQFKLGKKFSSSNSIFQTVELQKLSADK